MLKDLIILQHLGADRLKITATLARKDIDDPNDENFVQLTEVINGGFEEIILNRL